MCVNLTQYVKYLSFIRQIKRKKDIDRDGFFFLLLEIYLKSGGFFFLKLWKPFPSRSTYKIMLMRDESSHTFILTFFDSLTLRERKGERDSIITHLNRKGKKKVSHALNIHQDKVIYRGCNLFLAWTHFFFNIFRSKCTRSIEFRSKKKKSLNFETHRN